MTSQQSLQFRIGELQRQLENNEKEFYREKEAQEEQIYRLTDELEHAKYLCGERQCQQCLVYTLQIQRYQELIDRFAAQFPAVMRFMETAYYYTKAKTCYPEQSRVYQELVRYISEQRYRNIELDAQNKQIMQYIEQAEAENKRFQLELYAAQQSVARREQETYYYENLAKQVEALFARIRDLEQQIFIEQAKVYIISK